MDIDLCTSLASAAVFWPVGPALTVDDPLYWEQADFGPRNSDLPLSWLTGPADLLPKYGDDKGRFMTWKLAKDLTDGGLASPLILTRGSYIESCRGSPPARDR